MNIPKSFELMGQEIKVKFVDNIVQRDNSNGLALYRFNEIEIQRNTEGCKRTEDQMGESFCHELIHNILNQMEEDKLRSDEKLVGLLGSLLYQFMKTAKY